MPRVGLHALSVFAVVATIYLSCPLKGESDLIWSLPTAFSVLRDGDANLDEYQPSFASMNPGGVRRVGDHFYNYYPMGPMLLVLGPVGLFNAVVDAAEPLARPFPKIAKGVGNWQRNFTRTGGVDPSFFIVTEMVLGSLIAALAAVFLFRMAAELLPVTRAWALTGVFALCTSVWSTASRDLGQHGPSILMLSISLWLLVRARRVPSSAAWAGLFVALAYVMRPTNSLSVIALTAWVAVRHRQWLLAYLGLALVVAVPFCAYNLSLYSALLPPYYQAARILPESGPRFLTALAGNLVSPARGLFIYSPVLLFAAYGFWLEWRRGVARLEAALLAGVAVLHWLVVSSFPHWWGGHSNGPRFMTDLMPYLCYLLVPVIARLEWTSRQARALTGTFAALALWSAFTHGRSATSWAVYAWNARPEGADVDQHPERLWDFGDPPFLRGL